MELSVTWGVYASKTTEVRAGLEFIMAPSALASTMPYSCAQNVFHQLRQCLLFVLKFWFTCLLEGRPMSKGSAYCSFSPTTQCGKKIVGLFLLTPSIGLTHAWTSLFLHDVDVVLMGGIQIARQLYCMGLHTRLPSSLVYKLALFVFSAARSTIRCMIGILPWLPP
jgi:hypothetical protein